MKNFFVYLTLLVVSTVSYGQSQNENATYLPLIPTTKVSLLKEVDVIFNTRLAMDNHFLDGDHISSQYSLNQFRFEVKGKIHEKVFFRFRNRYTKIADPSTIDNTSRYVDLAHVIIDVAPQTKLTLGKMIGDWGGYELLRNPIEILSYNTINQNSDIFLVGAALSYALPDHKNTFNVQVLNARTKTFQEQFGTTIPPGITASETPLGMVANWKGHLFDGKMETTYSFAHFIDAKNAGRNYFSLGNKLNLGKLVLYYDFQFSHEDLDQKGVVSNSIKNQQIYAAQDVTYIENWIRAEYKIQPKVSLLLSLMNNNSYWNGNPDLNKSSNMLTSYGVIPTIEFTPFSDLNMKFYVAYIGKKYDYSTYAERNFNAVDYSTGQFSVGIIAPFLVL